MRRGGEMRDEFLESRHVRRDAFQDEVDLARQHPALPHQRLAAHEFLESAQIRIRLARQMDGRKYRDVEAEPARIEQAAIALDVALLLQGADPAQAAARRNA